MNAATISRVAFAVGMVLFELVFSTPVTSNRITPVFTQDLLTHSSYSWTQPDPTVEQIKTSSQSVFGASLFCPTSVYEGAFDPLNKRSMCPWIYETDHDAKRFPTTILKATPLCTHCIGSEKKYECNPVSRNMTVLRQDTVPDAKGNYRWFQTEYTTTVAYTCAGRRIADNVATKAPTTAKTATINDSSWAR